jgi:hypothetical protein
MSTKHERTTREVARKSWGASSGGPLAGLTSPPNGTTVV